MNVIKTVSVVICAYNEEKTVGQVIEKVRQLPFVTEIVIIDNGSTDRTGQIIREAAALDARLKPVVVDVNQGLGDGLLKGIAVTTGDIVVRQDADLEYDPDEIKDLIFPIVEGKGHVSYGSRMLVRRAHKAHYYYNYLANILFTCLSNIITNINLTDVETASKAFSGPLIRAALFTSKGFDIEIEMTFKLRRLGAIFYEVPISYYGRSIEEGKKIRFKDAIATLVAIIKHGLIFRSVPAIPASALKLEVPSENTRRFLEASPS